MKLKKKVPAVLTLKLRKNPALMPPSSKKHGVKLPARPMKLKLKPAKPAKGHPEGRFLDLDDLHEDIWYAVTVYSRAGYAYTEKLLGRTLINRTDDCSIGFCSVPKKLPKGFFDCGWLHVLADQKRYFSAQPVKKKEDAVEQSVGGTKVPISKLVDRNYYLFGVYSKKGATYNLVRGSMLKRAPKSYGLRPLAGEYIVSSENKGATRNVGVEFGGGVNVVTEFRPEESKDIHLQKEFRYLKKPPVRYDEAQKLSTDELLTSDDPDAIV